ncbi:MAG: sugar kinase [Nitrospirota bacterium]|nr:MAG: sugar kinase [Nitrospirota bacterium]
MHVTGIGQCSWDYLSVVDSYPQADTKKEVIRHDEQGGGPVATALVTLSKLGVPCSFIGIVGDDEIGDKITRSLGQENIDLSRLIKRPDSSSQVAHIIIGENNSTRTIFWKRPSGTPIDPDEIDPKQFEVTGFLLLDGLMKDASLRAARIARDRGIPVMLDAGKVREGMIELAKVSDYIVGSEEFARDIGWNDNPETFKQHILNLGFGITTITLGNRGSITFADNRILEIPAFTVKAIDTTGAGDVFHGGYIFGLLSGWNIKDIVTFASAVAAIKCESLGGRSGIPDLDQAYKFLRNRNYDVPF